jgi:omega-6 fatty acid desaturase (delta-12 desaturase)
MTLEASSAPATPSVPSIAEWKKIVATHTKPSVGRAVWQIVNSIGLYALLWFFMWLVAPISWWLVLPFAFIAGLVLVRVFIICHDCGHGSFFKSKQANEIVGRITSFLTFTPYHHWRWQHAIHHATSGDLDRRGIGDIWTLTVQEYLEASRWKRFAYRLARNPFVLFVLAPVGLFLVYQRFSDPKGGPKERHSVWLTNLCLFIMAALLSWAFGGVGTYVFVQLMVTIVSGAAGVWMFYVQHQFEDVYWERGDEWDYTRAALEGSSYYKLPKILQWFTGNIGFHHIHHLSSRIPNYNLERCHNSHPIFTRVKPITFWSSLKTMSLRLWDEQHKKLVGFRRVHEIRKQQRMERREQRKAA